MCVPIGLGGRSVDIGKGGGVGLGQPATGFAITNRNAAVKHRCTAAGSLALRARRGGHVFRLPRVGLDVNP